MSRHNKFSLLCLVLGIGSGATALCIPDTYRWWIPLWMVGIQLIFSAAVIYYRGQIAAQDARNAEAATDPEIGRIAARITSTMSCDEALRDEHQLERACWDTYEGAYLFRCNCGFVCGAPSLVEVATEFAGHHDAYVRIVGSLRKVHESTSPILEKDVSGLGAEMDKDWILLSAKQQKEVALLSVEIAWRLDAHRGTIKPAETAPKT
jgi:hypothetical protein